MTAQKTQGKLKHDIRTIAEIFSPVASHNGAKPKPDFDEEAAQERRRQERLKRKKEERRDDELEEEESENLIPESRKAKRKKKKKERPALWVDERYEDEMDEVFETNGRSGNARHTPEDDWLGDWEENER
jgi:hypothetical protein